jgi:hypothetical protein
LIEATEKPDSRLRALAAKATAARGAEMSDFDWRVTPRSPVFLPRSLYVRALSQFYHGERAAQALCRGLVRRLGQADAEVCLEAQIADETRHAEIFHRYMTRIGGLAPPERTLVAAHGAVQAWRGAPEAVVLACHILLETEALRIERAVDRWCPCPLFREIGARIARDEARHVAFGTLYLRESLPQLPLRERLAICEWLHELWTQAARFSLGGRFLEARWRMHARGLAATGLYRPDEARLFVAS